jgi:hypothetical protein
MNKYKERSALIGIAIAPGSFTSLCVRATNSEAFRRVYDGWAPKPAQAMIARVVPTS